MRRPVGKYANIPPRVPVPRAGDLTCSPRNGHTTGVNATSGEEQNKPAAHGKPPPDKRLSGKGILLQLHNWRVAESAPLDPAAADGEPHDPAQAEPAQEIEGELAAGGARPTPPSETPDAPQAAAAIPPLTDDFIVATLAEDDLAVHPGAGAALTVQLVNNGPLDALFSIYVEGWVDVRWLDATPVHLRLQPGEQGTVTLTVSPPRLPESRAGERQLAVVVRSPAYPGRQARLPARLTVHPFDELYVGELRPHRVELSWTHRSAVVTAPITNLGNRPARVRLAAHGTPRRCRVELVSSRTTEAGGADLVVEPGQAAPAAVRLVLLRPPLLGLRPLDSLFRLGASHFGMAQAPTYSTARLRLLPLLGPRQLAALAAFALFAAVTAAGLTLAGLALWRMATAPPAAEPPPAAAQPMVAIILRMEEPVPTRPPDQQPAPAVGAPVAGAPPVQPAPGVPIVQADQVTAPGQPTPIRQAAAAPAPNQMTYAQMFQEVALRYDIDWRILAATAYVESEFDSLAVGGSGALGLMQVQPETWREWSATVDAADPFDSYQNVLVAAAYLDYLRSGLGQRGYPGPEWMLAAYNWGPDRLATFLETGQSWDGLPTAVRNYADRVLSIAGTL